MLGMLKRLLLVVEVRPLQVVVVAVAVEVSLMDGLVLLQLAQLVLVELERLGH